MRRLLLVSFSLFLALFPCAAQGQNQTTHKVSGTVLNAVTGAPVGGARVQAYGSTPAFAITGPDGHFQISGVMSGHTVIAADRPGFYADSNQQKTLDGNSDVSGMSVKLIPLSKITGRILDRDGAPIEGVSVTCLRQQIPMGVKQWLPTGSSSTDESGFYLIENLQPGTYYLYSQSTPLYPNASPKAEASRYVYPETFYPEAETRHFAQPVDVAAGTEARLDMTLRTASGIRVTATTNPHFRFPAISLIHEGEEMAAINAQFDQVRGVWIFSGVTPGAWKLVGNGAFGPEQRPDSQQLYGELEIQANGQDIPDATVTLFPLPEIRVDVTGGLKNGVQVSLQDKSGGMYPANIDSNGSGFIADVHPGSYRVNVEGGNECIASVTSGGQDLLRQSLIITAGATVPPIQIQKGDSCPQLTLTLKAGAPAVGLIIGSGENPLTRQLWNFTQNPIINDLPEGEYTVYAFDNLNDLEYKNPEVMRGFKSQAVSLQAGQKTSVQLELNERQK